MESNAQTKASPEKASAELVASPKPCSPELVDAVLEYEAMVAELAILLNHFSSREAFLTQHRQWLEENPDDPKWSLVLGMTTQAQKQHQQSINRQGELMEAVGALLWSLLHTQEFHDAYECGPVRIPKALRLHGQDVDLHTFARKS